MNNIPSKPFVAPLLRCESRLIGVIVTLAITLTMTVAEKHNKQHRTSDAPFLKPAEAVAKMEIPEGFDVSIFAAEPDIGEPIAFTFASSEVNKISQNFIKIILKLEKNLQNEAINQITKHPHYSLGLELLFQMQL
mgnify:CR=1 FL=1